MKTFIEATSELLNPNFIITTCLSQKGSQGRSLLTRMEKIKRKRQSYPCCIDDEWNTWDELNSDEHFFDYAKTSSKRKRNYGSDFSEFTLSPQDYYQLTTVQKRGYIQ